MFDQLLESAARREKTKKPTTFIFSIVLHSTILLALFIVPLFLNEILAELNFLTFVSAPPNPEASFPQAQAKREAAKATKEVQETDTKDVQVVTSNEFTEPTEIKEKVSDKVVVAPIDTGGDSDAGLPGGTAVGGSGAGSRSGTPGLMVSDSSANLGVGAPPPPPPPPPAEPVKVGGNVLSSKLVNRVEPIYPEIAKKARVQGIVILKIVVDENGNVASVAVHSGHPMLAPAAMEAVKKWRYTPTELNGIRVPVEGTVVVNFTLR